MSRDQHEQRGDGARVLREPSPIADGVLELDVYGAQPEQPEDSRHFLRRFDDWLGADVSTPVSDEVRGAWSDMAHGMWAIYLIADGRPDLGGHRDLASLLSQQLYNVSAAAWAIVSNASVYNILGAEREQAQSAIADIDSLAAARRRAMSFSIRQALQDYPLGKYADMLIGCIEQRFGSAPDDGQEVSFARVVAARYIYGTLLTASGEALSNLRAGGAVEASLPEVMEEWLQSRFARLGVGSLEQADVVRAMIGRLFPDVSSSD